MLPGYFPDMPRPARCFRDSGIRCSERPAFDNKLFWSLKALWAISWTWAAEHNPHDHFLTRYKESSQSPKRWHPSKASLS
eukprot:3789178-Alexandrium_andersonii.AAC.1